ncbi:circadian-associated transcriptional repressor-like [Solea senegalensis]|uniref:Circadian-associated transcriptional repressor-like n=1 Tax=Solea senegalensis TaxID=28829 RepID=A0AAV6Q1U9_SOLSE|nr:circadian-associated transcriptional repressor-like [Solea senegalensis]KAG7481975.1 circadian-associated transcriptional repressor-like [Solea senegalensis]
MSTSDSDYSIDWLASDEEDYESPKTLSPRCTVESSSSSSSSSSSRESPTSCVHSGANQRRMSKSRNCADVRAQAVLQTPAFSLPQGSTSVCLQQTLPVESQHRSTRKRANSAGLDGLCEKNQADTENELFSHKCLELQCYIQPLSSILRSLKSGRYSERLSSFQESIAMDRIQRILGVLQNPNMGGRFLRIILKIEEMLRSWFPQIKPNLQQMFDDAPPKKQKRHSSSSSSPAASHCSSDIKVTASFSSCLLKWCHTSSPICSLKTTESAHSPAATAALLLPARYRQEVTQDNVVSSSTDSHTRSQHHLSAQPVHSQGLTPFTISSPCLKRLLQTKDSIITPRTVGDEDWLS